MDYFPPPQGHDIRDEISRLMHGDFQGAGIGRSLVLRQLTSDTCACFDKRSGSPNDRCPYCKGEGYKFREKIITGYIARNFGSVLAGFTSIPQQNQLSDYGLTDSQRALAYVEYDVFPDYERYTTPSIKSSDSLYELKVTETGSPAIPYIRTAKWRIRSVTPHHGDFGRVEYFELGLDKENL